MRKTFAIAALALGLSAVPALAADMPVKAQPTPFVAVNGSGFYWGVGTSSRLADATANSNLLVANLATGNTKAAGQSIDGEIGWIWGNASLAGFANWARVYASASYQNVAGGVVVPGASISVVSRWSAQQGVDVNFDVFQYVLNIFNWQNPFPTFSPQLPSNIAVASSPRQYVGAFVTEVGLGGNVGAATGTSWAVAGGVRTGYLWQLLGTNGKPNGMALDAGVQVAWMPRGTTFSNVFAANGAPLAVNPTVNMGTTYSAYVRVLF